MNSNLKTYEERTKAFEKVLLDMKEKKHFAALEGWRNENYHVKYRFSEKPLFEIERSSVNIFGLKAYGCHINGYVKKNKQYFMWIARRSKTKPTYPNMLDNFVNISFHYSKAFIYKINQVKNFKGCWWFNGWFRSN